MLLTDYLIYSLKVAALMAVFYLFWRLLLERETLHRLNRMVLLGTAVGSFVLPMCVITFHQVEMIPVETGVVTANHWVTEAVAEPTLWERWSGAVGALLLVVTVLMLLHLIYNIWQLHRFIGRCELHTTADGVRIAVSDEPIVPSSWMRTIMLSRSDYDELSPAVLAHERSHIRHHHSCDVLLVELVTALQWFNPVVWMIRQDLRTVHEYEADAAVIGSGTDMRTYFNMLIQKATGRGAYSMANGISNSTLKKRFKRMLKKKSNRWCGAKALYVIPVVALSLAATAKTIVEYRQVPVTKQAQVAKPVAQADAQAVAVPGDKHPIVFIDGKEVSYDQFKQLKSEQIETMTVLKDEKSTAAYGEKGKNGVILVSLKKNQDKTADDVVKTEQQGKDPVYDVCEVLPEYPGGMEAMMKFVSENIKYPAEAHTKGIQGRVLISYVVEKDGSLSNIHVVRSVDPLLDAEALRVANLMPKWKPGKQGGKPVRVKFTLPVTFKLQA